MKARSDIGAALVVAAALLAACAPEDGAGSVTQPQAPPGRTPDRDRGRARDEIGDPRAPQTAAAAVPPDAAARTFADLAWADAVLRDGPGAAPEDAAVAVSRALAMLDAPDDVSREAGARVLASLGAAGAEALCAVARTRAHDAAGWEEAVCAALTVDALPADVWILAFAECSHARCRAFERIAAHPTADAAIVGAGLDALGDGDWVFDDEVRAFARGARVDAAVLARRAADAETGDDAALHLAEVLVARGERFPSAVTDRVAAIARAAPDDSEAAMTALFAGAPDFAWTLAAEIARSEGIDLDGARQLLEAAAAADPDGTRVVVVARAGLESRPAMFGPAIRDLADDIAVLRPIAEAHAPRAESAEELVARLADPAAAADAADSLVDLDEAAQARSWAERAAVGDDRTSKIAAGAVLAATCDEAAEPLLWALLQDEDWGVRGRVESMIVAAIDAGRGPDWSQLTPDRVTNAECARAVRHWLVARGRPIGPDWRAVVEVERFRGHSAGPETMDVPLFRALLLAAWRTPRASIDAWLAEDPPRGIAAALASGEDGAEALIRWVPRARNWHAEALAQALETPQVENAIARPVLGALLDHPEASVRAKAAWTCHIRPLVPDDASRRIEVLLRDEDTDVRHMAVYLLATAAPGLPADVVRTTLRAALGDASSGVSDSAAWAIGDLGIVALVPDLVLRVRFDYGGSSYPLGQLGPPGLRALAEMLRTTKTADAADHASRALAGFFERANDRLERASGGASAAATAADGTRAGDAALSIDSADDATAAALRTLLAIAGSPFPAAVCSDEESRRYAALVSVRLPADAAAVGAWAAAPESSAVVRGVGERLLAQVRTASKDAPLAAPPITK